MDEDRVVIADVLRTRGNKGEVLVRSQTDVPGRLENLKSAVARLRSGTEVPLAVEAAWPYRTEWVLKFAGVNSISDAEQFAGAELWIAREERGELPAGDFFQADLIGCLVLERDTEKPVGSVTGVENYGASPLLEVDHQGRAVLIPMVDAICSVIDIQNKRILVDLPDGLLDL